MKRIALAVIGLGFAASASAQVYIHDDFEGYADQAGVNAAWPLVSNAMVWTTDQSHSATHSMFSSGDLARRQWRSLGAGVAPTNANPLVAEFWMLVPATNNNARHYSELRSYASDACGVGALEDLYAIGLWNAAPTTPGFFQGRAPFAGLGAGNDWFNLSVPRTAGWHKFAIEIVGGNTVNYYVDNVLGATIVDTAGGGVNTLDCFVLGSGLTSTGAQSVYFDDVHVERTPEPASLALLALGALSLLRRR